MNGILGLLLKPALDIGFFNNRAEAFSALAALDFGHGEGFMEGFRRPEHIKGGDCQRVIAHLEKCAGVFR